MKYFKRLINIFTFRIERFILGGPANQLLFIAGLIVVISLTAGLMIHLSGHGEKTAGESIWWAFLRLSDPGYLGDDKGSLKRLIATILIIMGYVLFMGSLVAIMAQWLNSSLRKLEAGLTPIRMRGHILILGWNNRTSIIIREIILSEERVNSFLESMKRSHLQIVILTPEVNQATVQHLKNELGSLWNKKMIYFRSGNHLRIEDLQRVDFLNAGVIIMPGNSNFAIKEKSRDSNTAKTIMTISSNDHEGKRPLIAAEIFDEQKTSLIADNYNGPVEIITSSLLLSRIISQNIRHKNLSGVYAELLCNDGNEIYITTDKTLTGKSFREIRFLFSEGIPLGLIKLTGHGPEVRLCPHDDQIIDSEDQIIILAENFTKTTIKALSPRIDAAETSSDFQQPGISKRILIISWSRKIPFILRELNSYVMDSYEIDIFSAISPAERNALVQQYEILTDNISINHYTGNPTVVHDLKTINPESYDTIFITANDFLNSSEEADARTLMSYLIIEKSIANKKHRPQVIVELTDPDNSTLYKEKECEIIISPLMVSYTLSQIALRRNLNQVYDVLFGSYGAEIAIVFLKDYGLPEGHYSFHDLYAAALKYSQIAIGLAIGSAKPFLNPPTNDSYQLTENDRIVVLQNYIV